MVKYYFRAYSASEFRIAMKKFRLSFRAEDCLPRDKMPTMKELCKFIEKLCGVLPTPGAVRSNIYRDYGKVHELLGIREIDSRYENSGKMMMDDDEYIKTHYDKDIDLTAEEIEYLKKKDLYEGFYNNGPQKRTPKVKPVIPKLGRGAYR